MVHPKLALFLGLSVGLTACSESSDRDSTGPESAPEIAGSAAALVSNTWATKQHLLTPVGQVKGGMLNNIIYVVGGLTSSAAASAQVQAYNVATNSWSLRKGLPSKRRAINGVTPISGRLYVAGGFNGVSALTRTLLVYSPATDSWVQRASMPRAGSCGAQGTINGLLYVYVGCTGVANEHWFYRYNPATNTWTALPLPPSKHSTPSAAGVIGGKFYLAGGLGDGFQINQSLHVFNPATNTWATRAPIPSVQANGNFGVLNGKLYAAGGADENIVGTVWAYTPGTNSWASKAPLPTARYDAAGVAAGGLFFVLGGSLPSGSPTDVNEAYTP
jgi:N-acetylneuraminic acid mutarotase